MTEELCPTNLMRMTCQENLKLLQRIQLLNPSEALSDFRILLGEDPRSRKDLRETHSLKLVIINTQHLNLRIMRLGLARPPPRVT